MKIRYIALHHVRMRLKTPVVTSFGSIIDKDSVLAEVQDSDGITGWGEAPAFWLPWYSEETIGTILHIMENFLIPRLAGQQIEHPRQVNGMFAPVQRNHMAKAGLESAVWDLYAKRQQQPLTAVLGGTKRKLEVGVVVGMQATVGDTVNLIESYLVDGYKRIKLKIKPGQDIEPVKHIRKTFPGLVLSVDANGAYTLADIQVLRELDQFQLAMLEQPFAAGEFIDHAKLQARLQTPICLDESIATLADARLAAELASCRIISIKMSRAGGIAAAQQVHDFCLKRKIPVWCGGMFETGVGRAHNIALSTLANFSIPGDISGSSRYWEADVIEPEVVVTQGEITVGEQPGIGYQVKRRQLKKITVQTKEIYLDK